MKLHIYIYIYIYYIIIYLIFIIYNFQQYILRSKQIHQRLRIRLAQVKTDSTFENLLNEIC